MWPLIRVDGSRGIMEALLPLLIKIVQYGPQKAAIETGTSVLQAVNKAVPEVMPLLERAPSTFRPRRTICRRRNDFPL
jgi:hypothetical protein